MEKDGTSGFILLKDRRHGIDRREFSYTFCIPERRVSGERRRFNIRNTNSEPGIQEKKGLKSSTAVEREYETRRVLSER
jgi:hypothetical protein